MGGKTQASQDAKSFDGHREQSERKSEGGKRETGIGGIGGSTQALQARMVDQTQVFDKHAVFGWTSWNEVERSAQSTDVNREQSERYGNREW